MRATGIIRRIDDLGRVVIPKEIRRQMRIKEGDPLEIYTTREGMVCFQKYTPYNDEDWNKTKDILVAAFPSVEFALYNSFGEKVAEHILLNNDHFEEVCLHNNNKAVYNDDHDIIAYIECDRHFETIGRIVIECLKTE